MEGKWTKKVAIGEPLERLVVQLRELVGPLSELQERAVTGLARVAEAAGDTPGPERSEGEDHSNG